MEQQEHNLIVTLQRSRDIYKNTFNEMQEINKNSPKEIIDLLSSRSL